MMQDQAIANLLVYYEDLKTERAPFEGPWRDTAKYTRPTSQFNQTGQAGSTLTEMLYDGTSIHASNRLAAELLGMSVNPNSRNHELHPLDRRLLHDYKYKQLCQYLSEGLQYLLHEPSFGFYTSAHEMFVEYVSFGQGHQLIEKIDGKPRYLACPLSQVYSELDDTRKVNAFVRSWRWTLRQLRSKFSPEQYPWPSELLYKLTQPQQVGQKYEICHAVVPSVEHPELAKLCVFPKKYTHVIFCPQFKHIFEVKGLDVLPMVSPRYLMMAEESYGRGPGTLTLPDTRMVNQMERTNLRAVQKLADPPLVLPRRGWLKPIDVAPSALNYYDGLEEMKIQSFGVDGNPQLSADFVNQHRMQIREMYQIDDLVGPNKRAEVKEVEVLDMQEQRMRAMSPQLARIYTEWLSPTLQLLLYYFNDELLSGYDGELPDEFLRTGRLDLKIAFMSPLQRAQSMLDAANVKRVLDQFLLPIFQFDQSLMARFSGDGYTDWLMDSFNLPTKLILPKEEADQQVSEMQQQQSMMAQAGTAVDASQALKNVAEAQAAMPQNVPGVI